MKEGIPLKIVVFSDTHKNLSGAERIILTEKPDLILHLGDHIHDAYRLKERFPEIPLECVPGNCDYAPNEPETKLITVQGLTLMLTHGHTYRVKYESTALLNAAYFQGADIVLFGHTHRPVNHCIEGLYVVNPGTAGQGSHKTCAKIEIEEGTVKEISILEM